MAQNNKSSYRRILSAMLKGKEITSFKGFIKYQTTDTRKILSDWRKKGLQMCSEYRTSIFGKRYKVWWCCAAQVRNFFEQHPEYEKMVLE